jgi:hypothetical protein
MAGLSLSNLCTPASVYFWLGILGVAYSVLTRAVPVVSSILHLFFVLLWTWFLNFLCSSGYKTVSWILTFVFAIMPILVVLLYLKI